MSDSFWLVVHAGQRRPKIVEIKRFYSHRSNPGMYRTSWTILQSSLKAAHPVKPQRTRAPSQEKIRTNSYPGISFSRCCRCSGLELYCRQALPIACSQTLRGLEHSCLLIASIPEQNVQSCFFPVVIRQVIRQTCGTVNSHSFLQPTPRNRNREVEEVERVETVEATGRVGIMWLGADPGNRFAYPLASLNRRPMVAFHLCSTPPVYRVRHVLERCPDFVVSVVDFR